jgi:hypothetical protein
MGNVKVTIQAVIEIEADRDFASGEDFVSMKNVGVREALDNLNKMISDSEFNIILVKSPSVCSFKYIDNF